MLDDFYFNKKKKQILHPIKVLYKYFFLIAIGLFLFSYFCLTYYFKSFDIQHLV